MNDNKRKLYDALSKDYDMGTYEQFCSDISDNDKRKKLYDAASKDYDFGDYDSFSNQLGFSQAEQQKVETPAEPATPVSPQPIQADLNTANSPADTVKTPNPAEVAKPNVEVEAPVQEQPSPEQQQRRALEASTREQVAALRSTIDDNLNAATQESVQAYRQEEEEARKGGFWKQLAYSLAHDVGHDPASIATRENLRQFKGMGNMELQGRIAALQSAQNSLKDAQRMIDEADHNAQSGTFGKWLEQSFAGGVARGLGQHLFDVRTWDMGMSDLSDNSALIVALNKYDKGEDLTESEQMMLDAKAVELATNAYFGSYVGRGYKAGSVTAESIPFMLEMCINPASGTGRAASSKLTRYALERFGKQAVKSNAKKYVAAKAATRVAADIAGAAAMAATSGSIGVAADAESRMAGLNNGSFTTNEEGYSFFNGYREGEDPATALAKAFGARTIENHSELVGEYFAPVIGVVGKGTAKGLDKVGLRKVNDFIKDVRMSDVGKLVADFENHAHWNGLFGEFAEELVGGVENALVVGDQTIDANPETGVFNPSQMLDTFLGVSLMGGFLSSAKTAGYVTSKFKAGKDLNNADARGQALFGDEMWNTIKADVTTGIEDNDLTTIDATLNDAETSFHKQAILDYLGAYANKKGADIGSMKRRTEGDIDPLQFEAETSYDNGYELTDPQEMEDAQNMLEYRRQQLKEKTGFEDITLDYILHPENNPDDAPFDWLPDQKQAGIDYINAKATYEGMIQHVKDDIESKVTAAHAAIDANTNVDTKRIQPATMKTEDRKVYVVGGVVRPYEDGTGIDKDASSASVVIKDVNTGALEMVSPADILSLDEEIDPVDEKNAVQEQIRSTVAQEAADKIDGKIMFATGQQYTLPDAEGNPVTYQITPDPLTGKLADYTAGYANAVIVGGPLNQDGTPVIVQIPIAPIQEQHDMESMARLQQYEQGRLVEKIAVAQTEQQSQSAERQYQQEDELSLRNADGSIVRGSIVSEPNEDGQYEVYTEEPFNGKKVNLLTREEIENSIVLYNGQEVQNPVEEVAQETAPQPQAEEKAAEVDNRPAIDRIPVDEAGEPVFEKGQAADTWQALLDMNEGNADEARDTANQMYEQANAELEKALKAKPKAGKTVFEIQQNKAQVKSAVKAAQQKASYWKSIVDFEENQKRIAEEEAKRQKRIRMAKAREILRKEGRFKEENAKLGEPVSFRDYVLRAISTGGVTFKWANDKNNPAIKGLGSHLGFTNQQGEMVRRAWMLSREDGLYPEQAAEDLLQGYAEEMGMQDIDQTGIDTMDAFSEVLDVINSYDTPRRMFEAAQELHGANDLEAQQQAYYESQLAQETEVEPEETQPTKSREELVADVTDMLQQSDGDMRILDYIDDSELQQFSDLYNKFMQVNEIYGETSMRLAEAEKSKDKKVAEEAKAEIAAAQKAALDAFNPIMDLYNGILEKYNLSDEEIDDLPSGETTAEVIEQARQEVNVEPTEGQKKAGNYKMGHIKLDGYDISLENPKGSVRKGVDENGKAWESEMKNDYGYLRGTEGVDGDHIDVFLSDTPDQGDVFVVDQVNPKTGEFDEHKVMYGFNSVEEARAAYLANYEEGWQGLGNITPVSKEEFKKWVDSSHRKTKPFAEYASVKPLQTETPSTDVKESLTTAQEPVAKEVDVEGLFNALNTKGEAKLSDFAKGPETVPETEETVPEKAESVPESTESVPKKPLGTIRTGKHTKTGEDLWIVTPADRVSKEEFTRLKAEAKKRDGYYSSFKPNNGFIFKTEEDANAFNEENAREVSEPITLNELESVVGASFDSVEGKTEPAKDGKPATKWKYDLYVSKDGNSRITRSDIGDGSSYPVGDARFNVTANNPVELKEILENNGMSDILEEIGGMLDVHIDKWNFRQKANTEGFNGYKIGDNIIYNPNGGEKEYRGVVVDFTDYGDNLPIIDTGSGPVMYEVALLHQIRHAESKPETEQEQEQPKQEERPVNPSGNKLVTDERYAELRRRMMNKLTGQMNIGIDPEILAIGTEMAVYHIEKGARKFAEFAKAMIQDLSDAIRPYLKAFYNGARDLPEMSELSKEMTPYDEVSSFDVANFDKNTVDALAAAETIVKEEDVAEQVEEAKERIKNTVKSSNSKKKTVSSQGESMGSLFSDVEEETESETTNTDNNELSTGSTSKNGEVGEGKQQEVERPSGTGVVENNHEDSAADQGRSTGLAERAPKQPTVKKNKTNNHVERGETYAPTTPAQRFSANVAAIRKMRELMDADRKATPEDMEILRKFTGWGGIGTYFNNEYSAENRELKSLLGDEEYQAAVMSANSAYYTPVNVIDAMWDAAKNLGFTGGTVLEGSAGIGNILASMPKKMSEASDITAVEIDSVTGNILKLLYPEADVNIKGFEETDIPNNSVDLAITNVPFVTGLHVYDKVEKDLSRKFGDIHDFCIAKNVRKLKEGGIGIFITSKGTLDKSKALRNWVVNEGDADFIGAFRLNNTTFIGTSVTSDIIIIRKRVNGKVSPNAIDVSGTTVTRRDTYSPMRYGEKDQPVAMEYNSYFVEHPEFMAGEMKFAFENGETFRPTSSSLYPKEGTDQDKALAKWVKTLRNDAEKAQTTQEQSPATEQESTDNVKEGQLIVNSKGEICLSQRGKAVPIGVNSNKVKGQSKATVVKDYDAIKDALKEVLDYQVANESDEGLKPLLKKLNDVYDSFVKKYGQLNKNVAISFLRNDVDFATIAAIEDFNETETIDGKRKIETEKTDVFSRRMVGYKTEPTPKTSKEGVIVSMNKFGHIDLEYIASKIGLPVEDVRKEIIESKLGYEDPQTGRIEVSYEYLSGNVREKLEYARSQNKDGRYDSNIKALEKVIPYDIPAHLIEFSLGSDWLDKQLYIDFAREKYGLTDEFKIANIGGVWQVVGYGYFDQNNEKNRSAGVTSETVGKTAYGHELMICAMNNTPYTFSKTVKDRYTGETTTITDKNASQVATGRMAEIKDEFRDWCRDKMMNDTSLAEKVQKVYNDLFNAIVPKEVGEEFLPDHFEGSNIDINLYAHQKKAVIRGTTEPLMLAHEVGSGKTFTLISTAMEMRRLGTAKKPMIVAQNATVGQFVSEAKKLYPNAKVLSLTEKDRSQEGRLAFYAKIKYNDWDLIIIPQSTFDLIPDSEERQQMFVQEKIDEKMYVLEQARMANADSNAIRRLEKELKDLETEYNTGVTVKSGKKDAKKEAEAKSNAAAKAKKQLDRKIDDVANFDDMGIDALLIDEAHEYKHLGFSTSIKRGVKGVDPSYSKKSAGVYLKTRAVFDKSGWKNVVFATGTPISNTAAEIWTFMKYLMPADVMKQNHIYYFDDFVRNFGKIAQSLEFATNGKFKENTRFGAYVNVPELVRIWSSVCDTVLTKDAEAASGTKLTDKLPAMEGGKAEDIFLPQSPSLIGIMRAVRKTLEEYEKLSGKEKKEQSHIPLTMYGIAKRAAIDPRLVDADAVDEPLSKTNRAVEEILKDLEATKAYKGTCAVFCDNYRRLEYDETGKKKEAFNLFQEIKRKLVEAGVPENQIVVMESGMSIEKKEKIFAQVNDGSIRVILGSTRTLGTGVNIQQRLHLLIHMDAPDRPMDYTQRNGRILRQGNLHKGWGKTVKVLRFGVEDSLDVTSYQRLKTKSSFIDSIMDGKPLLANGMEGRVLEEEEEGLFDNPVAVLSGSQFALKMSQAERELRKYQGKLKQYQQDQIYIERQLKDNKNRIANNERFIKDYEASIALAKETFKDGKVKVVTVVGVPCRTEEEINTAIREKITKPLNAVKERARNSWGWNTTDYEYPLSFDGITVKVKVSVGRKEGMYVNGQMQKPSSFTVYSYSCSQLLNDIERSIPSTEGVKGIIEEFRTNLATGIYQQNAVNRLSANIERMTSDNELMLQRRGVPFAEQDKLDEAKARVDEYTKLMKEEMAEKEKKYAEAQAVETKVDLSAIDVDDEDSDEDTNRYRSAAPSDVFTAEYPFKELRRQWIEDGEIYNAAEANDILQQLLEDFPDFEPAFARFLDMNEKNLEAFWETGGRDVEFEEEQLQDAFNAALDEEILNAVNPDFDNAESKEKTALSLAKALGVNVNVIADREEITDSIRSRQRRKRNSKGWYDTLTQEIVVVLQNNVNNADVEATILHEIVGHKGMRELVGEENYNDFLEKVYRAADVELRKRITELAARKGWDFNLATEEYIASLAESGFKERQERSLLEKIRDLFVDMLHRAKIALGYNINDNDLRYMLWRSYKGRIKSALDLAEDINARMEMQVGDYADSNKNANFVDNERRGNQTNDNDRSQRENGTGVAENNARRLGAKHTLGDTGVFEEELAAQRSRYSETDGSNFIQGQIGESLIDIAKRTGRFIPWEEAVSSGTKLNGNTKESICFVSDDLQKITKLKDPYAARATKGNSPFDIIEELIFHNELFPDTAYRLVGITQDRLGDMRFVLEQDFVKYESFADENDIADYLQKLGLKDEGRFIFGDERCAVLDAYGENVLVDENGKLRFIDPIIRIKQSPDDNLRYRSGEARDLYETAERRVNDEGRKTSTANLLHRLHEAYQDSMLALKELQKAISKETGNPVEDNENAYMAENAMSSQNKAQADIYRQRFYTPLLDSIRDLMKKGARYNDIVSYAICKHGLERNEYMARRKANEDMSDKWKDFNEKYSGVGPETTDNNLLTAMESERAKLEEQEEKLFAKYSKMDFSGLKGITGDEDNFTDIAEMIVADFEKLYDTKPLWEKVNKATKETLYKNYASGLMSRDTYNKVRGMFDYYIPLRGWDSDVAANEYDYLLSSKPLFSQTLKTMQGRTSVADDPFATIGHMAESAIALGNRNLMKQKFLNFVLNNPTSLATVSKQWYVLDTATQEWEPRNPYIPEDASPEQVTDIIEQFEKDMAVLESQGFAKTKRSGLNLSKHVTVYEGQEHVVRVKRNGVEYAIYINGNPRAAQALNGLTNPNASKSNLLQKAQAVKNFMARMFTSQNPAFIITNLSRDAIWSGTAVAVKENAKYNEQYQKNILNALAKGKLVSLVSKFNNGKLDDTVPIERYFSEFIKNGGETGFTQLNTVEDFKREMRRFVKDIERGGTPVTTKVWRSIWDGVEFMNRCAEDTTRFAVYMTSRQMGRTVARSVFDAKEITVNFNKKGSGGYLSQFMNFAYIFFNATIQSIANITKLTKENPGKMSAAVGLYTAAGIITPLLALSVGAAFGGGDDDDEESYWDLPEWVRRNNLVFRIPWSSNGYITIPLPHELRPFYGLGEIAFSCYMGKEKVEDGLVKGAEGFTSMIPLDFTGNAGNTAVNFTPTIAQPFAQLIANVDFFGTPIYKRNDYNKLDPEWTKAYKGTNAWIVNGTKWLNDVTGGNNVKKGAIDLNPAVIEHLYESYLGGVGKTINRAAKTVSMIWDDEMREWRNVPVASSFIQTANERTSGSQLNREYFNYKDEHDKVEHELAGYKKQLRMGAMEYADVINEFMESEEFQRYRKLHGYVEAVSKMNSALKYSDETRREELEESIKELKRTLVEELHKEEDSNK